MDRVEEFNQLIRELSIDDLNSLCDLLRKLVEDSKPYLVNHRTQEKTDD